MKNRLKTLRESYKLSQSGFAGRLGINQTTVSRWENGATAPTKLELLYISKEFGVRLEWLEDGSGAMKQSYDDALNDAAVALFRQLPDKAQEAVLECLRYYNEHGKWKYVD